MLNKVNFKISYNTSDDDIISDFFKKVLQNSKIYKRAVGYFTSGWFEKNLEGIGEFISNNGKLEYIISPIIDEKDIDILTGNFQKEIEISLDNFIKEAKKDLKNLLAWLVYDEILTFKIAIPKNRLNGDFHDKFGIFIDKNGNKVSFSGSLNETIKGFNNYENIKVFCDWKDETSKNIVNFELERFNKLWENKDKNLSVYDIDTSIKNKLLNLRDKERPYQIKKKTTPKIRLREYQKEAIENWFKNKKGILEMATGSGKTFTALSIIDRINKKTKNIIIVVVVPYQHLVTQWSKEAKFFNIDFFKCFESSKNWIEELLLKLRLQQKKQNNLFIITTNTTFMNSIFNAKLNKRNVVLVVDEVHNFGSKEIKNFYLDKVKYRLGLSATPRRYMDEEGTNAIFDYFGDIVFKFSLKDAIKNKFLTPYYYYPLIITVDETDITNSQYILSLKLEKFKKLIIEKQINIKKHNLFYCGITRSDEKMIDKVYNILKGMGSNVEKFTSLDSPTEVERSNLIINLDKGIIDGLVAIRCLDEGVDIPSVKRAFLLASSNNLKEFIQRRGRILRKHLNKEYAEIYDFVILPDSKNIEKEFFQNELLRFEEFSNLSLNKIENDKILQNFMGV